jgi:hypothetical protein
MIRNGSVLRMVPNGSKNRSESFGMESKGALQQAIAGRRTAKKHYRNVVYTLLMIANDWAT